MQAIQQTLGMLKHELEIFSKSRMLPCNEKF